MAKMSRGDIEEILRYAGDDSASQGSALLQLIEADTVDRLTEILDGELYAYTVANLVGALCTVLSNKESEDGLYTGPALTAIQLGVVRLIKGRKMRDGEAPR